MGTITKIRPKSGQGPSTWCAQIRIQWRGIAALSTSQTFRREAAARSWLKRKEEELAKPGGLERTIAAKVAPKNPTLGDAIDRTLSDRVAQPNAGVHRRIGNHD